MSIRIALTHKTHYRYDRLVAISPQLVRLRPAPHCRTRIESYSLELGPSKHYLNWQQDPHGNYLARAVFQEPGHELFVNVGVVADMTVLNPFDFFLEEAAEQYPFCYDQAQLEDLKPFLQTAAWEEPALREYVNSLRSMPTARTIDFLVAVNRELHRDIDYVVRLEPGVQTCEETLALRRGSCRDSAWLLVNILRHLGLAARFTSGYLIQLKADVLPLDGPSGPVEDFTDLHAWTEVFLPGAGWVGLDPTSGLLAGEGHIPLACTPSPQTAAPISGAVSRCEAEMQFSMSVRRIHEDPRVTKPYTEQQWSRIESVGHQIDERLVAGDVRLTMGGEPTFVSIDDMEGAEWKTEALGEEKYRRADKLFRGLTARYANGPLLHFGQGKWYPGEPLPRWCMSGFWRRDGEPIWQDPSLVADTHADYGHTATDAQRFAATVAEHLGVSTQFAQAAHEDVLYYIWKEQVLPVDVDLLNPGLEAEQERRRMARIFGQGITQPVGYLLPLQRDFVGGRPVWKSSQWLVRSSNIFLVPGDSPMGYRLPMTALIGGKPGPLEAGSCPQDPMEPRLPLPQPRDLRKRSYLNRGRLPQGPARLDALPSHADLAARWSGNGSRLPSTDAVPCPAFSANGNPAGVVRTAMCVEPRRGRLHVFLPPTDRLEDFLELVAAVEDTASMLGMPVVIEGYGPPPDDRINHLRITPDPGVIEANVQPAHDWSELVRITTDVYDEARLARLGTEKFDLDGKHTGTGGGNHVVLGGPTPADSPFLRRPDLLRSLVGYWNNHPCLSYLFSGAFIGPTSQAPRVDEGCRDALYELQIASEQIPEQAPIQPWLVDRLYRHLLVDITGNTHRAEFCIDKLYSPDSSSGRLGLVEFRAFEMPPHSRMSLTQQLLIRALVARFWDQPYQETLVDWGTTLHDRFLLPHFVLQDFRDVIRELNQAGLPIETDWFAPHFEFRFPQIGTLDRHGVHLELRNAIEPWYVLGEEQGANSTARYVDSSVERLQVKVQGMTNPRYAVTCNGRRVPLHPSGTEGEFVAGVRYRAWQPPSCLHPTITVDEPLVFDLVDQWQGVAVGGCQYHVSHPGGLNPATYPVNANEAESRRAARFYRIGHTQGHIDVPAIEPNPRFPMTLDLRRGRAQAEQQRQRAQFETAEHRRQLTAAPTIADVVRAAVEY